MKRAPFDTLLIANRGEIAVRILRAARELGLATVAVYSDADADARHVLEADRAVRLGPAPAAESYLLVEAILAAARSTGAGAIHPGYGFLSENPALAEACEEAGIVFVGPPAGAIRRMGDKAEARRLAEAAGVPVIPGYDGAAQDEASLRREAERIGWPLLLKPAAGGGGKGMKLVESSGDFGAALASSQREAGSAFGDARILLERFLRPVRHVEIQVFADSHGGCVHLLERECSIQRRHQKILEESPSPALDPATREAMGQAAVALARAVEYRGAGTVEFVLSPDGSFHFLEMNTRLQVEHPVTEAVTGIDLVHLQLREAMGAPLPLRQEEVRGRGHAIECRIYAEDPSQGFLPAAGPIRLLREPQGPGIRVDSGILEGGRIGVHYDPILSKLIVWAETRAAAVARLKTALRDTVILGLPTNLPFLQLVVDHPAFQAGETFTSFVEDHFPDGLPPAAGPALEAIGFAAMAEALTTPGAACHDPIDPTALSAARGAGSSPAPETSRADRYSPWDRLRRFRTGTAHSDARARNARS